MAPKKKPAPAEQIAGGKDILVFKATRPLSESEHTQLSNKIRQEHEATGIKIVLMPYTCDLEERD